MRVANSTDEGTMHRPTYRNEWNVNTYILIGGFCAVLVGWGITWGSFRSDVNAMDVRFKREVERIDEGEKNRAEANEVRWKDHQQKEDDRWKDHEQVHRDRAADNANTLARMQADNAAGLANLQARVSAVEATAVKLTNFEWRLTKVEDTQQTLTKAVEDIRTYIGDLATDQKIMREILQRLDPEGRAPPQSRNPPLRRP